MQNDGKFQCIECGKPIKSLYIQYSPGNIRLKKCENCKAVADEYIECEIMIIVIDLILHKPKVYRHLFYNMFNMETLDFKGLLFKLTVGFSILDTYRTWALSMSAKEEVSLMGFHSLMSCFGKIFMGVAIGNLLFMSILLLGSTKFLNASFLSFCWKDALLAILISSYFKIFLVAMVVWEFPSSIFFIVDMFVISSNTVALKVITDSATIRCLGLCLVAYASKILAVQGFRTLQGR